MTDLGPATTADCAVIMGGKQQLMPGWSRAGCRKRWPINVAGGSFSSPNITAVLSQAALAVVNWNIVITNVRGVS
jgi:hypothetical protein